MRKTEKHLHNTVTQLERREFMRKLSSVMGVTAAGAVLSSASLASAMAYQAKPDSHTKIGKVFDQSQMLNLKAIADTVFPETDTASGGQVDCHGVVDHLLANCHNQETQQGMVACVSAIIAASIGFAGVDLNALSNAKREAVLNDIEAGNGVSNEVREQFRFLKYLIAFAYFTSEVGATQVLSYQAVPGGFKGSIKVTEKTKTWSSKDYY
jgi:hypothetical protein